MNVVPRRLDISLFSLIPCIIRLFQFEPRRVDYLKFTRYFEKVKLYDPTFMDGYNESSHDSDAAFRANRSESIVVKRFAGFERQLNLKSKLHFRTIARIPGICVETKCVFWYKIWRNEMQPAWAAG